VFASAVLECVVPCGAINMYNMTASLLLSPKLGGCTQSGIRKNLQPTHIAGLENGYKRRIYVKKNLKNFQNPEINFNC